MLYRALHTISSQKYRLPVRRYIIDLFNIELDADVVKVLSGYAVSMRMQPAAVPAKPSPTRIISIVGRPGRQHQISGSDEEDMLNDDERKDVVEKPPVMSLRPMSRIFGFD